MSPAERLIVALDQERLEAAERVVGALLPLGITRYKVGLSLYAAAGPAAVEAVHRAGGKVFLDLKFHDIPNTVARAVRTAARMGVWMANVHIQGGSAMLRRALEAVREEAREGRSRMKLVGVTILTSMAQRDLADLGMRKTLKDQVLYLAKLAKSVGLDGIVASAQEAQVVRWACGDDFLIVTPGIRLKLDPFSAVALSAAGGGQRDDQERTASPSGAIRAGADYLVVGRPLLEAPDPVQAAREMLAEIGRS